MTSQIEEIPSLQVDLRSMIRAFFETLNADQVLLLLSGTMDDATRPLLLALLSNIINNLSLALQARVMEMNAELTEELVTSSLGNVVTESFKAALDVKAQGQSRSAETLRDMISQEVMVSVQCSMCDTPKEHVTAPKRLDRMLKLVTKMFKAIKKKMFKPCAKGDVSEPEQPAAPDHLARYLYRAESMEHGSEEDQSEVSLMSEPNCCWYNSPCVLDGVSDDTIEYTPFVCERFEPPSEKANQYHGNYTVLSATEENGSEESDSTMEFIFPGYEFEEQAASEAVSSAAPPHPSLEEVRKNGVLLVVERLVSLTYARSNVNHYMTDPAVLIERLMARTWAAVEGVDFEYSPKTFANLEETIFRDLVKKWRGEALVLANMKLGSPALDEFVVDAVKARLEAQAGKPGCVRRFFSSVGGATDKQGV